MNNLRKQLFNDYWKFTKQQIGTSLETINSNDTAWNEVEIPHDWLILDTTNLYETSEGWYRKVFSVENIDEQFFKLCFDGVYMNSTVFVNDIEVGTWRYGYSSFEFDITKFLKLGENIITVRVKYENPNTRWYSGAGIYRNVWLKTVSPIYLTTDGVYISTDGIGGNIKVQAEITNAAEKNSLVTVKHSLLNTEDKTLCTFEETLTADYGEITVNKQTGKIENPTLWDLENTYLYKLKTQIISESKVIDEEINTFGFRNISFDSNEGFNLNGKYMKLRGVCMHHDLGALGAANNQVALERQLQMMKDMGVNAIRTSHNMPSRELIEICNRIGLLVDTEAFDMWENPKNPYDYARFFKNNSKIDIASWVRRDRNNPCIIMWCIGNEIHDTHASLRGLEVAKMLKSYVLENDPNENAYVTIASNYIAWENAQLVADELKFSGYNYGERLYDDHHEKYPDWIIYGSETASNVRSRGIYHFPASNPILMHEDLQCSSMDNSAVSWGSKSAEYAWIMDRDRKFCAGQFIWTGFDYIGEPTPYSTKNSYFGIVDTAGLPKDIYYMYQSEWTDYKKKPIVHLLPYWDWNIGQEIEVYAYTNAPKVELFFNGTSKGIKEIDHTNGNILHGSWILKYEKGVLEAKAYDESGSTIANDRISSFEDPSIIVLKPNKTQLLADGRDLIFVEINTIDKNGEFVSNARNRIDIEVTGAGRLVGLDNGDSTDYDSYKGTNRKLFSGKLVAIIEAKFESGQIIVKANSNNLTPAEIKMEALPCEKPIGLSVVAENIKTPCTLEIPVRKIELTCKTKRILSKENPVAIVNAKISPASATYSKLDWKVTNSIGIDSNLADVNFDGQTATVTATGDGIFKLCCTCNNGGDIPQVISELEFKALGLGNATRDPYVFTSASYYTESNVPLNVVQDKAIGGFNERTYVSFAGIDFGKIGTEALRLYVGNCGGGPVPIEIWKGTPDSENGELISKLTFPLNGRWDGFEPYDFALPKRLTGVRTINVVISDKIIFGGFEFIPISKAFEKLYVNDCNAVYGDAYNTNGNCIENIGNNVVISFEDMDFGKAGATKITISGKTPNDFNTIQLRSTDQDGQRTQLLEFAKSNKYNYQTFNIENIFGKQNISFVFLPGSNFDFEWFKFE
jgi:beta-galactosidase